MWWDMALCELCGGELDRDGFSLIEAMQVTGKLTCDICAEALFGSGVVEHMTWNHRIVKHSKTIDGNEAVWYSVHEVYYDDAGAETNMTQDPITFVADTPEELIENLKQALEDAKKNPIFIPPEKWERCDDPVDN